MSERGTIPMWWKWCAVFVVTLVSSVLLGCSFAILTPLQMGILLDSNLMDVDDSTTHFTGRRFVGLGRSFIKFPITYDIVQYGTDEGADYGPVSCRSSDGLPVTVQGSFAYKLSRNPKDLVRLYRAVGDEDERPWHILYMKFGLAAIRDVTARYKVEDFFPKREQIANDMQLAINNAVAKLYASVHVFELTNMNFPREFADAIEFTQVQFQDNEKALAERQVVLVEAEQNLAVVGTKAAILTATADTEAAKMIYQANAAASALQLLTGAQVDRMQKLRTRLNFTTSEELLDYLFVSAVQNTGAGKLFVNLEVPPNAQG